jgi:hypothetical protein
LAERALVGACLRGEGVLGFVEAGKIGRHDSSGLTEDSSELRVGEEESAVYGRKN